MRRSILLAALALVVPLACSEEDEPAAETREGFCSRWADAACNAEVVSSCQAASADACRLSQEGFCLDLVPAGGFAADQADVCIEALRTAYADANLSADELDTVVRLGSPCDRLVRGARAEGESCESDLDCDAPAGFACVVKGSATTGTCQTPVVVQPGRDCSAANAVCTEDFYCDGENCVVGGDIGDACVRSEECEQGFCDPSGACAATLGVDEDCVSDDQCAPGICYRFSAGEQVCIDRVVLSRTDPICEDLS